jgi:hypothetical protein
MHPSPAHTNTHLCWLLHERVVDLNHLAAHGGVHVARSLRGVCGDRGRVRSEQLHVRGCAPTESSSCSCRACCEPDHPPALELLLLLLLLAGAAALAGAVARPRSPCPTRSHLDRLHHAKRLALGDGRTYFRQLDIHHVSQLALRTGLGASAGSLVPSCPCSSPAPTCAWSEMPTVATPPSFFAHSWLLAYLSSGSTAGRGRQTAQHTGGLLSPPMSAPAGSRASPLAKARQKDACTCAEQPSEEARRRRAIVLAGVGRWGAVGGGAGAAAVPVEELGTAQAHRIYGGRQSERRLMP